MTIPPGFLRHFRVTVDLVLGVLIMGTTGAAIGYYLDGLLAISIGLTSGAVLGGFISMLEARVFFLSVIAGTVLGSVLAMLAGGPETLVIGAGSGAAAGGFVGVNIDLFRKK